MVLAAWCGRIPSPWNSAGIGVPKQIGARGQSTGLRMLMTRILENLRSRQVLGHLPRSTDVIWKVKRKWQHQKCGFRTFLPAVWGMDSNSVGLRIERALRGVGLLSQEANDRLDKGGINEWQRHYPGMTQRFWPVLPGKG